MRTILSSCAEAATALLAVTAGATGTLGARTTASVADALQPESSLRLQPASVATLAAMPLPKHIAGHAIPNHCVLPATQPNPMGVALAYYDEDLSWLGERRHNATIYSKRADSDMARNEFREWVDLPNIGLESHTYLYHIVSHWDCLDDATLFTQGRADDSVDNWQGIEELFQRTLSNPEGMILYRHPGTFNEWWGVWHFGKWKDELESGVMRKSERNPGDFWRWMFHGEAPPEKIEWTWSATFAVRRETIKRRPRRFYQRLLHHFEAVNHVKPEEGHFMERFWMSIFKSDAGMHHTRLRRDIRARRDALGY